MKLSCKGQLYLIKCYVYLHRKLIKEVYQEDEMKNTIIIFFFLFSSLWVAGQTQPQSKKEVQKVEKQQNQNAPTAAQKKQQNQDAPTAAQKKQQNLDTHAVGEKKQPKQVPKVKKTQARIQKTQQQHKKVKNAQMQQRRAVQTQQRKQQRTIQRRGNHK
jgi:hypothetical protein